jgi:hypothetical protein
MTNMKQLASAVPVKFCDYKDCVMTVAGILRVPTICSKDILLQARGFILVKSTQIRSF